MRVIVGGKDLGAWTEPAGYIETARQDDPFSRSLVPAAASDTVAYVTVAALEAEGTPEGIRLTWTDENSGHPCYVRDTAAGDGTAYRTVRLYIASGSGVVEFTVVSATVPADTLPAAYELITEAEAVIRSFHP